ncbi:MAG: hypothetical protein JNM21_02810 [Taibaiella sp.]|nr:hypothetical protein [Taibaiella sp.]
MWRALFESILKMDNMHTGPEPSGNKRRSKWAEYLFIFSLLGLILAVTLFPGMYRFQNKLLLLTLLTLSAMFLGSLTLSFLGLVKVLHSMYPQDFLLLFASITIIYSIILCVLNLKFELISLA